MSAVTAESSSTRRLSAPILVGGAFALSTLLNVLVHVGEIVFTDKDPYRSEGPVESIVSVGVVGGAALVIALAVALATHRSASRAKVGAIVLGVLAVLCLPVFWSGASASFGATAAWLGGLTKDGHPQTGAARGFGVVGLVLAILIVVATMVGIASGVVTD